MGWQPGDDGWRPRPRWLGVLWIAVVALALAGCAKGQAKGQEAASTAGLPVYKVSVQKFKYSGMPTSIPPAWVGSSASVTESSNQLLPTAQERSSKQPPPWKNTTSLLGSAIRAQKA